MDMGRAGRSSRLLFQIIEWMMVRYRKRRFIGGRAIDLDKSFAKVSVILRWR